MFMWSYYKFMFNFNFVCNIVRGLSKHLIRAVTINKDNKSSVHSFNYQVDDQKF